ncbi:MAG: hypothetical protein H7838_12035 [Magnetococcus sp. DMHC-8]
MFAILHWCPIPSACAAHADPETPDCLRRMLRPHCLRRMLRPPDCLRRMLKTPQQKAAAALLKNNSNGNGIG